ncbi:hypothetical protein DCC81_17815 [Chitinophaga parva]|uniref:Alginate lyase domain-containing protein n=1 Tax=Chitinophaga parva TaxID=2169414 RepID=A0A2T7BIK0_9BACT|nr:alginate lyase family protein [Chitinophaga parva]PUZ26098.1 hypothetical protein DCC81_17815 [Chitinophaga parva]
MKNIVILATLLLAGFYARAQLILVDGAALKAFKTRYRQGDTAQVQPLLRNADAILAKSDSFSVTFHKVKLGPSGDAHDYVSMAPYWWPDSTKPNGVPYVRRDGHINPERYLLHDNSQLVTMASQVKQLGVAYYFSGKEAYAQRAATLLRTWFADTATRMHPNLNYGQYVPGVNDGRGIGIIETAGLMNIPDAVAMLEKSPALDAVLVKGLKQWFREYLHWLLTSKNGMEEHKEKNNHGTFYDLQVCDYALFTGQPAIAKDIIIHTSMPRMEVQFTTDGQQPLELARTKSWSYSLFNLSAWTKLAVLAQSLGTDLWAHTTTDGRGLEKCIQFLLPFDGNTQAWQYEQIEPFGMEALHYAVLKAAPHYTHLPAPDTTDLNLLLY